MSPCRQPILLTLGSTASSVASSSDTSLLEASATKPKKKDKLVGKVKLKKAAAKSGKTGNASQGRAAARGMDQDGCVRSRQVNGSVDNKLTQMTRPDHRSSTSWRTRKS